MFLTRISSKFVNHRRLHAIIIHMGFQGVGPGSGVAVLEGAKAGKEKLSDLLRRHDQADQNAVAGIELNNQGAALAKAGNMRAALKKYRAALERYPEHVGIRLNFAIALLRLGRWLQGIAELSEVVRRDPRTFPQEKPWTRHWPKPLAISANLTSRVVTM